MPFDLLQLFNIFMVVFTKYAQRRWMDRQIANRWSSNIKYIFCDDFFFYLLIFSKIPLQNELTWTDCECGFVFQFYYSECENLDTSLDLDKALVSLVVAYMTYSQGCTVYPGSLPATILVYTILVRDFHGFRLFQLHFFLTQSTHYKNMYTHRLTHAHRNVAHFLCFM